MSMQMRSVILDEAGRGDASGDGGNTIRGSAGGGQVGEESWSSPTTLSPGPLTE